MDALLGSVTIVNSVRHALFTTKKTNRTRMVEVCKTNLGFEDHYFRSLLNDKNRIELQDMGIMGSGEGGDKLSEEQQSQLDKAEEIILAMVGNGKPVPAHLIYNRGEEAGIHSETMKKAKKLHPITAFQKGKRWMWQLQTGYGQKKLF